MWATGSNSDPYANGGAAPLYQGATDNWGQISASATGPNLAAPLPAPHQSYPQQPVDPYGYEQRISQNNGVVYNQAPPPSYSTYGAHPPAPAAAPAFPYAPQPPQHYAAPGQYAQYSHPPPQPQPVVNYNYHQGQQYYPAPAAGPQMPPVKRALLVGINYTGTQSKLNGCVNDVRFLHHLLSSKFGFVQTDFYVLTDDDPHIPGVRRAQPTRRNIIEGMRWLVGGVKPGDSLFFQFSGHGSQVKDMSGDEADGYDETILPIDFKTAGQIVDDEMHMIMVKPLPAGARLHAIIDACHSGTGLDLPYVMDVDQYDPQAYSQYGYNRGQEGNRGIGTMLMAGMILGSMSRPPPHKQNKYQKKYTTGPVCAGDVFLISGCDDHQTSADTNAMSGGTATGACTYALCEAIEHGIQSDWHNYTYGQLLKTMRDKLKQAKYTQRPQLSCSRPIQTTEKFWI